MRTGRRRELGGFLLWLVLFVLPVTILVARLLPDLSLARHHNCLLLLLPVGIALGILGVWGAWNLTRSGPELAWAARQGVDEVERQSRSLSRPARHAARVAVLALLVALAAGAGSRESVCILAAAGAALASFGLFTATAVRLLVVSRRERGLARRARHHL